MKNLKDIKIVRDVIAETLHSIGGRNCRVRVTEERIGRGYPAMYIDVKYVDPINRDEVQIEKYWLTGTTIQTGFTQDSLHIDLNEPGSIDLLKATLGFQYDTYAPKRWKAIVKLPWSLTKCCWRVRKSFMVEAREWLNGRFVKSSGPKLKS
jgi:hypothetical protein